MEEKCRIDKFLWCVRIFKTRSLAAKACNDGKVKMNDENVKASKIVKVGEEFEVNAPNKLWKFEVKEILQNRVGAPLVENFITDKSPAQEKKEKGEYQPFFFNTGKRRSKIGRPTKKSRRDISDFFEDV
jgi:ribosome-associated heat shock protein Hsp15